MIFLIFYVLALLLAGVHLYFDKRQRTPRETARVFLLWFLVVTVGVGGFFAFLGHTVFATQTARSIGWPSGNPFQTEVAVANLAIAVLGILCYFVRGNFWTATVIVASVWPLGDAVVHIQQIIVAHNYAPNNAGIALYFGILIPLTLIVLLLISRPWQEAVGSAQARVR